MHFNKLLSVRAINGQKVDRCCIISSTLTDLQAKNQIPRHPFSIIFLSVDNLSFSLNYSQSINFTNVFIKARNWINPPPPPHILNISPFPDIKTMLISILEKTIHPFLVFVKALFIKALREEQQIELNTRQ